MIHTLEKKKKRQPHHLTQETHKAALPDRFLNVDQTSDRLVTEGCGQIDDGAIRTIISRVTSIFWFRSRVTKLELLVPILESK